MTCLARLAESGRLRAFVLSGPAETDGVASLLLSVFYGSLAQEDEAKEKALMRGHECLSSFWRPQGDLNPCRLRERQVSWARLDDGDALYGAEAVCLQREEVFKVRPMIRQAFCTRKGTFPH